MTGGSRWSRATSATGRWSNDWRPVVKTASCRVPHDGLILSGTLHFEMDDGSSIDCTPGAVYSIPAGHDAWDGTKGMNAARDLVEREKIFAFCYTMTVATTDLLAKYADEVQVPNVSPDGFGDDQYGRLFARNHK